MAYEVRCGETVFTVEIQERPGSLQAFLDGKECRVDVRRSGNHTYSLILDGESFEVSLQEREGGYCVVVNGREIVLEVRNPRQRRRSSGTSSLDRADHRGEQTLRASMPGRVVTVLVPVGQQVEAGQGVIVIEAMKMENELRSPKKGIVKEVLVSDGDRVELGQTLLVIA